jgi:DNA-binding NtrC family response regulator
MIMRKAKIMLIEDQLIPAYDLRRQLNDRGYEVVAVFTRAETALTYFEENKGKETSPDVVILDISLAGKINGVEACQIIMEKYDCEVIFMTGLLDLKVVEEILETKPAFFLNKPFDIYYTHICIQMAIHQRTLEREIIRLKEELKKFTAQN